MIILMIDDTAQMKCCVSAVCAISFGITYNDSPAAFLAGVDRDGGRNDFCIRNVIQEKDRARGSRSSVR